MTENTDGPQNAEISSADVAAEDADESVAHEAEATETPHGEGGVGSADGSRC